MADDDDTIWVDVKARVDEASADEAEHRLRDKFSHATDGIKDSVGHMFDGLGGKFKDLFSHDIPRELEWATDRVGDDIGEKIGDSIGDRIGSALGKRLPKELTDQFAGVVDDVAKDLGGKLGSLIGSGVNDLAGRMGVNLGGLADTARDVTDKLHSVTDAYHSAHDAVTNTVGGLTDAAAGFVGGKGESMLGQIGGLAEPFAVATGVSGASEAAHSWIERVQDAHPALAPWLAVPAEITNAVSIPFQQMHEVWDYLTTKPEDETDKWYNSIVGGGGSGGSSSTSAQEVDVTASEAVISAGSINVGGVSLPGALSGAGRSTGTGGAGIGHVSSSGIAAAGGDSGGMASLYAGDSGGATLSHFAGGGDVNGPGVIGEDSVPALLAPGEEVLTPAQKQLWEQSQSVQHFAGGGDVGAPEAPPAPSEGGGSGEGESVDTSDVDSTPDVGGAGAPGTAAPASPEDAAQADAADTANATDVVDPTQEGLAGGNQTSKGIQDDSYGYGKGFQVTGQGLIGFAESAPGLVGTAAASGASVWGPEGSAAGAAAALGAAAWNTIGEPELNEAITEGVKAGADLASAPSQEFAVGGENFQNWTQKILGGEIGNVTNLLNTAASTQAPLTPQQGSDEGLAGQAAAGQPAQLGGQQAPTGTQNDPMHVNIVGNSTTNSNAQSDAMTSIGMASAGTA